MTTLILFSTVYATENSTWCEPKAAHTKALIHAICHPATEIPAHFVKPYELPEALIRGLFEILKEKQASHETLGGDFKSMALRTRQLLNQADLFKSEDPAAARFKASARESLLSGEINSAVALLERASEREQLLASRLPVLSRNYLRTAAITEAANGELAQIRLVSDNAAKYFTSAASLLPDGDPLLMSEYLGQVGIALFNADQLEQAEAPLQKSLEILRHQARPEAPLLNQALNNLAALYYARHHYHKARPLYEELLSNDEARQGRDSIELIITLDRLADIYRLDGEKEKARVLYERLLSLEEKHLGAQHADLSATLLKLARVYNETNRAKKAKTTYQRALSIDEKNLGKRHPVLAGTLNELASIYKTEGNELKAQQLYERALTLELSPKARSTLLNNLAVLHEKHKRYEDATKLYVEAIALEEFSLGKTHPALATLLNNLASLHHKRSEYDKARPLYERALNILKNAYGDWYPGYQAILANYKNLPE